MLLIPPRLVTAVAPGVCTALSTHLSTAGVSAAPGVRKMSTNITGAGNFFARPRYFFGHVFLATVQLNKNIAGLIVKSSRHTPSCAKYAYDFFCLYLPNRRASARLPKIFSPQDERLT